MVTDAGRTIGLRLARRESGALDEAYAVYAPSLLAYLRRYVGPDDAEDVLQRTFLDAWSSAWRYDPGQRFSSWLFTIAHHRAVDALRSRRGDAVPLESARDLVGEDGRQTFAQYAVAADVRASLRLLPDHEREVILLAYFSGLSQREISERLDLPLGTDKARAARGTRHLGDLLRDQDAS